MTDPNYRELIPIHPRWHRYPSPFAFEPNAVDLGYWIRRDAARNSLRAMVSVDLYTPAYSADAGHWLHLSVSRATRLPTWADLVLARDELGYGDRSFVQLLPPRRAWLNIHSYCLHLVCRLDAPTVPEILWNQEGANGENYRAAGSQAGRRVT